MGRVRKYKRIKSHDPFYRGPRKTGKGVDLCPENESEQPMPRSLICLMKRAESLQNKSGHKKREKWPPSGTECKDSAATRVDDEIDKQRLKNQDRDDRQSRKKPGDGPMFTKRKGESLKSYLERIDVESNARIMEAYRKNRKPSERRKRRREERRKKTINKKKGLNHEEQQTVDFSDFRDDVKFGEVVQAPPLLKAKPRGSQARPPGTKPKSLLLHGKMCQDSSSMLARLSQPVVGLRRKLDLEIERERAISVYRQKKKSAVSK